MGAGQQAGFGNNRTHFVKGTTVDAFAFFHDRAAQDSGFEFFESRTEVGIFKLLFGQTGFDLFLGGSHSGNALLLVGDGIGAAHLVFTGGFHDLIEGAVIRRCEFKRLFCAFFSQIDDQVDHRLDLFMGKGYGAEHFVFGQLIGFRFHHHDGIFGACDNQIKALIGVVAQVLHVVDFRVQDVFAILEATRQPAIDP